MSWVLQWCMWIMFFFSCDNASCHRVISGNASHRLVWLPPYSPALNPIEKAFSTWKYALKASLAEQQNRIMDIQYASEAGLSMVSWRSSILIELAKESLMVLNVEKCAAWYRNMLRAFAKCHSMEDLWFYLFINVYSVVDNSL